MRRPFIACLVVVSVCCLATDLPDYRAGSLAKLEPQLIYSQDTHDPWNRIFYLLFTHKVDAVLTNEFKVEGPFTSGNAIGTPSLVTTRTVERIESGDRAIDPLYPNFFSSQGSEPVLTEPGFTELKQAIQEACAEKDPRPPLQRA
jgi:hypothetical protein